MTSRSSRGEINSPRFGSCRRGRQNGATALGFAILLVFVALFVFGAIRLTPVYLNYMKVAGVLEGVYDEFNRQNPTRAAIRTSIGRRFGVESVDIIKERDITITTDQGGFLITADYDHSTPFMGNILFTVEFEKTVQINR